MEAIIPQNLSILNDSVPEDEAAPWDDNTTYAVGDEVIYRHYHYTALLQNSGKNPADNSDFDGASWFSLGVTNKYACIDLYNSTQTIAPQGETSLTIQVPFSRPATALALLNMTATSVHAVMTLLDGTEMWDSGEVKLIEGVTSWWDYFFSSILPIEDKVFSDIPPLSGVMTITLYGGTPAIGNIIVGELVDLGSTLYGVEPGFTDFSRSETDDYGNEVFVKRRNAKRASFSAWAHPSRLDYIHKACSRLAGIPALWRGDNGAGFESMIIYGFLREFSPTVENISTLRINYEIRGVV